MARRDEKKTKKVHFDDLPDCIKRCIKGRKGCDETQRKIKNSQWVKKINDDIKKLQDDVSYILNQIKQQKDKDREYTWARTCQIGLLTIKEAHRIHEDINFTPRTTIGAVDFNVYGVDKYFGMVYDKCLEHIWTIKKNCRNFDRILAIDDEVKVLEVAIELKLVDEKKPKSREKIIGELATEIDERAISIRDVVYARLREKFQKIKSINIGTYHSEKDQEKIIKYFETYDDLTTFDTEEIKQMIEFFRKIIHDIIAEKTK